jgi:hypothetical protein
LNDLKRDKGSGFGSGLFLFLACEKRHHLKLEQIQALRVIKPRPPLKGHVEQYHEQERQRPAD